MLNLGFILSSIRISPYMTGYHNTADKYKDYDWEIVEWQ